IVCDLLQENWPSMDLVGDMLLHNLRQDHASAFRVERLRPSYTRHLVRMANSPMRLVDTAERALNRFVKYPRWLSRQAAKFDLFHIVDHSYAHLVHRLPPQRTVVTCHDTDAFRCLLESGNALPLQARKRITMRLLSGLQRAAHVMCDSAATAGELLAQGWVRPERISVVNLGVDPVYSPEADPEADKEVDRFLESASGRIKILHVGSATPRKRIDVLLQVFAEIRKEFPSAMLLRVGGPLTAGQQKMARQLGVEDSILALPFLTA